VDKGGNQPRRIEEGMSIEAVEIVITIEAALIEHGQYGESSEEAQQP